MNIANNIIIFPKNSNKQNNELTIKTISSKIINEKIEVVNYSTDEIMSDLLNKMCMYGFNVEQNTCIKELSFLGESIKSLLLKSIDLNHPLQEISDRLVDDTTSTTEEHEHE